MGMDVDLTSMLQVELLVWIFLMRILMVITSVIAYLINAAISDMLYKNANQLDFEVPLTRLVWITSILSIIVTFIASYIMIPDIHDNTDMWWILSIIISCGTIGTVLIPEFTKIFNSTKSTPVKEIVQASKEGGASLTIPLVWYRVTSVLSGPDSNFFADVHRLFCQYF